MVTHINIAGRRIGRGCPSFVIAEAGVNHNGDLARAHELIDVAADAGADSVKFQTFKADRLVTPDAPKAAYQIARTGASESQLDMLRRLELSPQDHQELLEHAARRKLVFLSTPFDEECADFLDRLGVPAFKIPSGEVTNLPFLAHVARKGKPLIVSSGMCTLGELEQAVAAIEETGNRRFALLHCVSNYPSAPADVNLRAMRTMATAFRVPVGYSDHTLGIEVAVAAAALSAAVIEKHFTLDRELPGPDHRASLEPAELRQMMTSIRNVEAALGNGRKRPAACELNTAAVARKSLVAAVPIRAGTRLTNDSIAVRRPGTGLPPAMRSLLVGRAALRDIAAGALLNLDMVA